MATFNWSATANGASLPFDPNVDFLIIDDPSISAADLGFSFTFGVPFSTTFSFGGKSITLQTDIRTLTTTKITFTDVPLSLFLVGDNTTGFAADDASNTLTGGAGDDRIIGLGGADSLVGGAGNDSFSTNATGSIYGNDTINGGAGFDTLAYTGPGSAGFQPITVNLALGTATSATQGNLTLTSIETVFGTVGADTFVGGDLEHSVDSQGNVMTERFRGNAGNDSITGAAGTDFFTVADYANSVQAVIANLATGVVLDGLGGTDTLVNVDGLRGGEGNDALTGGSLSRASSGTFFELFRGNAGNDTLNGGNATSGGAVSSSDRADYSNNTSTQAVNVNLAFGLATDGLGGTDTLIDIDQVYGGAGNDIIIGGSNNDVLDGGAGDDTLSGGAGSDQARYQQSTAGVIVNLSAGSYLGVAAGTANDGMGGTDTLIGIENVRGSDFDDTIRGSDDLDTRQFFSGDAGNDTIDGGAGVDFASYSDVALVLGGLTAFIANGAGTVVDLKGGIDTLSNIEGLAGTHSDDTLSGGAGVQWLRGNGGTDILDGGADNDWVLYSSDPTGVIIDLAAGTATDGWAGPGGLLALGGSDTLISIENAEGSDYADNITGSGIANELVGRAGNDTFTGGLGNDTLNGGVGIDTAIYSGLSTAYTYTRVGGNWTVTGADGVDTLTSVEKLQFSDLTISLATAANDYSGDGNSDILLRDNSGQVAVWTMNGGTITSGLYVGAPLPASWQIQDGSGDYDGDGKSDILLRDSTGQVAMWTMDSGTITAGLYVGAPLPASWQIEDGSGDYNGDGKSDILLRDSSGQVAIWTMDGGTITAGLYVGAPLPASWQIEDGSGDYNGDGKSDILLRDSAGQIAIWTMDGSTITAGLYVGAPLPASWQIEDGSGDYNGDGKSDILLRDNSGQIAMWTMDGSTITAGLYVGAPLPVSWQIQDGASDYDGDGKSDILLRDGTGQVAMWTMDGGTITAGLYVGAPLPADWDIL